MREDTWFKMVSVSLLLHVIVVGAFSIPIKKHPKRIDLPYYSVNLVGAIGSKVMTAPAGGSAKAEATVKAKAPEPRRPKPLLEPKEKPRSIAPKPVSKERPLEVKRKERPPEVQKEVQKKEPVKTTKAEVQSLDEKIREMGKRTQYMDVTGKGSGSGHAGLTPSGPAGTGGSATPLDPALESYRDEVVGTILEYWKVPSGLASKKDLYAEVSIKIRKDGQISDWSVDTRSGSRIFDESIVRALRLVPKFSPPPTASDIDLPIRFHQPQG
jgi:colicin import membrane protein